VPFVLFVVRMNRDEKTTKDTKTTKRKGNPRILSENRWLSGVERLVEVLNRV
jgi:hypothetical protein